MPNYRRWRLRGGTYFFTICLADRRSSLLTDHVALLREAYLSAQIAAPFTSDAMVVLPDHIHAVWTLPPGDADYSRRIGHLKSAFSRKLRRAGLVPPMPNGRKGESGVWQPRFWEHTIRDPDDYDAHVAYCHLNPVKHGYVARPGDWPFSSVHRATEMGRMHHVGRDLSRQSAGAAG